MSTLQKLIILASATALSSCANWPEEGKGGFSEYHQNNLISVESGEDLKPKHGLRFDYTLLKNQLSLLKLKGAEYCFPASVDNANQLESRIIRELGDGMYNSASSNIVKQRLALSNLESNLNLATNNKHCIPPRRVAASSERHHALALLNSDNQFAINSAELNPKYKKNLNESIPFLSHLVNEKVLIVGNADPSGGETYNLTLSNYRAETVKNYLINAGVPSDTLITIASGENALAFAGDSSEVRLVNRSVRIYLLKE